MNEEKHYLSQEKFDELKRELEDLRTNKRREIAEKLEYAKSLGDLSENSEYQEAREAQAGVEERISTVENILKSAEIVSGRVSDVIDVGSTVTFKRAGEEAEITYKIVGSEEAEVSEGKISNHSPVGESFLGKKEGDTVTCKTPGGEVECTITEVK